jgi:drug/metabolite transporter (DMT)-like permease
MLPARQIPTLAAYAAIYFLWGGSYLAIRVVVHEVPPLYAASIRYVASGLILILLSCACRGWQVPSLRQLRNAMLTGIGMIAVGYSTVFWAETRLSSWIVSVLVSTAMLWTWIGECFLLRSARFRARDLTIILFGLAGMVLVFAPLVRARERLSLGAACAVLASTIVWSAALTASTRVELPRSALQTAGLQTGTAGLVLMLLSWGLRTSIGPGSSADGFHGKAIAAMLYLVLGGSVAGFSAHRWLLVRQPVSLVATTAYVNPIVAMILGIGILHERSSIVQLAGAAVVLASIVLAWRSRAQARAPRGAIPIEDSGTSAGLVATAPASSLNVA